MVDDDDSVGTIDADEELSERIDAVAQALIQGTPERFTSIICKVERSHKQYSHRLSYEITCEELPDEVITVPTPDLHEASFACMRAMGADSFQAIMRQEGDDWSLNISSRNPADEDVIKEREEAEEKLWQEVYDARQDFFEKHLGAFPTDIQKLMTVHWPGGGLFDLKRSAIPNTRVFMSFGLSNPDVPSVGKVVDFERQETKKNKQVEVSYKLDLEAKTPRFVPPSLSGYGYEILLMTDEDHDRLLTPLIWFVESEINYDLDLAGNVLRHNGITIEDISVGSGENADFIVYPAVDHVPPSYELPSGTMHVLIATRITRQEMEWTFENGREELINRLKKAGHGQISRFDRKSVV